MSAQGLTSRHVKVGATTDGRSSYPFQWLYFAVLVLSYKFLLDVSYEYVSYVYGYQNFFYNGRTAGTTFLSWIMIICALPILKYVFDDKSASGNVLSLLTLFSVIPSISLISFRSDYDYTYIILLVIFWLLFYAAWAGLKPIKFDRLAHFQSNVFYSATLLILSASVLTYSYINTGLRFHFDLIAVYDIRAEARTFIAPFPLNYLVSFADNLLPVLAIYLLMRGRLILFGLTIFVIFVNFSITGTKQLLFVPGLGLIGYFVFRKSISNYRLLAFSIIFTFLCIAETWLSSSGSLHNLFTYRVLFIPTELHFSYYSYFQSHDILLYSQSILRSFYDSNQENIQFLIGEYAIGDYSARANNGLFSDAYMNLGVAGVLIYPLILAFFLRILDGAVTGIPQRMMFVVVLYVAFVLLGMTLTSALLTSGLIFLIFLLYSLPKDELQTFRSRLPETAARIVGAA